MVELPVNMACMIRRMRHLKSFVAVLDLRSTHSTPVNRLAGHVSWAGTSEDY